MIHCQYVSVLPHIQPIYRKSNIKWLTAMNPKSDRPCSSSSYSTSQCMVLNKQIHLFISLVFFFYKMKILKPASKRLLKELNEIMHINQLVKAWYLVSDIIFYLNGTYIYYYFYLLQNAKGCSVPIFVI